MPLLYHHQTLPSAHAQRAHGLEIVMLANCVRCSDTATLRHTPHLRWYAAFNVVYVTYAVRSLLASGEAVASNAARKLARLITYYAAPYLSLHKRMGSPVS